LVIDWFLHRVILLLVAHFSRGFLFPDLVLGNVPYSAMTEFGYGTLFIIFAVELDSLLGNVLTNPSANAFPVPCLAAGEDNMAECLIRRLFFRFVELHPRRADVGGRQLSAAVGLF
jgi:hypothetical protein